MQINTSRFGTIEIDEQQIINFPEGLIGFYDKKRFVILPHKIGSPFKWLQSLDDPEVAFIIIKPMVFMAKYEPVISRDELTTLSLNSIKEAEIYSIVVVPEDPRKMSANLLGPLVINPRKKIAKQVILSTDRYSTCHYIVDEMLNTYGVRDACSFSETK